ncbi:MAG: biotin/lipoyl-binding protein [Planctomycetales bacterium]|nr:biotin/lipoyl-binding protein [Planctomycetales bacterium]
MVVTVLAVAGIAGFAYDVSQQASSESTRRENRPAPLAVRTLRVGSLSGPELTQRYAGLLVAQQNSSLSFNRAGRVAAIHVHEGNTVTKGDVIAELDQEDLDAASARVQSELAAATARLDELIAGPREQTLKAAGAKVKELAAQVELAKIDADRQKQLAPRGATSRSELDSAVFGLQAAENGLLAAQAELEELVEGTRKEQIAAQRSTCLSIEARLREIETQRNDSRIVAPFDGRISARAIDEGAVVAPGSMVLAIVSDAIEAQVGLPPELAGSLSTGDRVSVWLRQKCRDGWIDRSEPTVRRDTRTRVVYVRFDDVDSASGPSHEMFSEMIDDGWIAGEVIQFQPRQADDRTADGTYWLPTSALVRGTRGLWTALVVPGESGDGVCQRRALEILKTDGTYSLVQGMIQSGDRVIADGLHRVTAGMKVAPVESNDSFALQRSGIE